MSSIHTWPKKEQYLLGVVQTRQEVLVTSGAGDVKLLLPRTVRLDEAGVTNILARSQVSVDVNLATMTVINCVSF